VDGVVVTVRVVVLALPGDSLTGDGLNDEVRPLGELVADSDMLPVNPALLRVMEEVVYPPATKLLGDAGLADIVKSAVTLAVSVVEWMIVPLVPVIVTV
jgi:hypothetical protein